ncbi:MAG: hypothetical protein ACI36Y_01555 [Coriobacteriales bacterium]
MEQQTQAAESTASAPAPKKGPGKLVAVISTLIFLVLAASIFVYLNMVVDFKGTKQNKGMWNAFYDLPADYIDVAYIGSSATSRYYNCPLGYEQQGIAVFDFGAASTPIMFYDEIVREIQTTQSPELYIFELRNLRKGEEALTEGAARFTIDGLKKDSPNRRSMIDDFMEYELAMDMPGAANDSIYNYYIPILRYHDRFIERDLTEDDFLLKEPYNTSQGFVAGKPTVTQAPQQPSVYTSRVGSLDPGSEEDLVELIDFADTLDAQVLFVLSPYSILSEDEYAALNRMEQIINQRGYTLFNFNTPQMYSTLDITWETDFYNKNHVNYLGCEKYTTYFAEYLKGTYGLEDHRGDAAYDSYYAEGLKYYEKIVKDGIKYVSDKDVADE